MTRQAWFDIAHDGWARLSASRPLGRLLLEAVQNAFDADPANVSITIAGGQIVVEDDAEVGIHDERLVYTLFLSDKPKDPTRRGRMGRGLKELIAAARSARVETVGTTIEFDSSGRRAVPNERARGTRIELELATEDEEARQHALDLVRLAIPPRGTVLKIDGRPVRRPRSVLSLADCELETVVVEDGIERATMSPARITIYAPRRGETASLFELGVPVQAWNVPWHCDVGQRVPLGEGRDGAPERFVLALKATLLEAMVHSYLDRGDLRADWVQEVIARWPIKAGMLDAYVSKLFPRGSVLGGTSRANDRAKQLGAHIVESRTLSHGTWATLSRVLETADDYVRRRSSEFGGEDIEPDETHRRFAEAVRWLARRIAGSVIRVRFFARDPSDAGLLEDAVTDVDARVISFNVRGPLRFDDVLEPATIGVVLHELAHLASPEHDHRFIDRLQLLGGSLARLLAEGGRELAAALRSGDPDAAPPSRRGPG
jgi:hypothetical protein